MSGINLETEETMINEMSSQWGVMLKGTGLDRNVIVRRLHDSNSRTGLLPQMASMHVLGDWFSSGNRIFVTKTSLSVQTVQCGKTSKLFG